MDEVNLNTIVDKDKHIDEEAVPDVNGLLQDIFHYNNKEPLSFEYYKLLKSTQRIPELLTILNTGPESLHSKISILKALKASFSTIRHYTVVFSSYEITTKNNERLDLIMLLLNQYVMACDRNSENESQSTDEKEYTALITEVLNLLISHVTCPIEAFEYVYSLFKPYLYKKYPSEMAIKPLTSFRFLAYFTLLSMLYGVKVIKENPYNYFYFSGEGEVIIPNEEEKEKPKQNMVTFDKNFSLFLWFKIGISANDFEEFFPNANANRNIVNIEQENGFKFVIAINNKNRLQVSSESKLSIQLKEGVWHYLVFATKPNAKGIEIEVFLNKEQIHSQKIKMIKNTIKTLSLFRNHFGEVSSMFMVEGIHYREIFKIFDNEKGLSYGVKNEKDFIVLTKSMNSNAFNDYQSDFIPSVKSFALDKANNLELRLIYMPSRYDKARDKDCNETMISLKDSVINAKLVMKHPNMNGVNNHQRFFKNLSLVNGLYNLLPLAEIIGLSHQLHQGNVISDCESSNALIHPLVTNVIIDEYSMLLMSIKGNLSKERSLKEPIYFFQFLSLFLEKLPSSCFTFNVYNYLRTLIVSDDISITKNGQSKSLINEIIVRILLNEKILFKFDLEIQEKIWQTLDIYYTNTKIGSSFDMLKIVSMLLEMDKERYVKFCCAEHASAFDKTDTTRIYDIRTKFKAITNVIQIILRQKPEDIVLFYSLLTKEISPCLQLFVVNWLSSFLIDRKTRHQLNEKAIYDRLMKNNFLIETTLFALSVASFDVRVEIMHLIKLISNWDCKVQFNLQQIAFIQTHLVPFNIIIDKKEAMKKEVNEGEGGCGVAENENETKGMTSKQIKYQEKRSEMAKDDALMIDEVIGDKTMIKQEGEGFAKEDGCDKIIDQSIKEEVHQHQNEETQKETIKEQIKTNTNANIEDSITSSQKEIEPQLNKDNQGKQIEDQNTTSTTTITSTVTNTTTIKSSSSIKKESMKKLGCEMLTLTLNQEYLFKYLNKEKLNLFCSRMFADLISWLTDSNLTSLVIHCLIKLCPYCDISSNSTFIELLSTSQGLYLDNLNKCKPFYNWLLETSFQAFLIQDPKLKGDLVFSPYQQANECQVALGTLISNSIKLHTQICMKNIYKLDYLLQWSNYYKLLYRNSNEYSQRLHAFIRLVYEELSQELTAMIVDLNEAQCDQHKTFLYFFSIVFEYVTILKIGANFPKEKPSNEKCLIDIPEYYSLIFNKSDANDYSSRLLYKKWTNYTLCKIICDKCFMIWRDKFSLKSMDSIVKTFLNNSNAFISQLNILTMDNWGSNDCLVNRGISLIAMFSNLIATIIDAIELESDLKLWLPNYKDFLLFIIVSSTNIDPSDNRYKHIQALVKEALAFGISFLIHQLDKKKGKLYSMIFKVLKELLNIIYLFTKQIRKDEEADDARNKDKSYSKLKTIKGQGAKTDCAVYELFNNMTRLIGEKILNSILTDDIDKELLEKLAEETFKQFLTENPTLWLIVDHIFIYNKLYSMRSETLSNVIPIYPSYCKDSSLTTEEEEIVLDRHYVDNTYLSIKKNIIKNVNSFRSQFNNQYELYIRKNKFEKQQLARKYRKIKHRQFLFRGFWSMKEFYYEKRDQLKYRILDHLTTDYTKPLLFPVIDYDFYLPDFSRFNKRNLFIEKTQPQKLIDMNTCKFIEKEGFDGKAKEDNANGNGNDEYNLLKAMHIGAFKGVTDENEADKKNKGKSKDEKYFIDFIRSQMLISDTQLSTISSKAPVSASMNTKNEPIPCCLVKPAYHIKGFMFKDSKRIGFFAYNWLNDLKGNLFDNERHTCFGSIFKIQIKKKEHFFISIPYKKIERIIRRKYLFKQNSMEVFTINRKSFYFVFLSQDKRDQMLFNITRNVSAENIPIDYKQYYKELAFENSSNELANCKDAYAMNSLGIMKKYEQWVNWEISTLELLMFINLMANRSFCDVIQYPVLPWIVTDYLNDDINKVALRDFARPMGMLEVFPDSINRKKNYIHHYKFMLNDPQRKEETPYIYGTHYSNSMYIGYYLMRLFPFSQIKLELQGSNFDNPNRLFNSLERSFYCAATQKGDIRELVPEFYYLPEMFDNVNAFDFGEIYSEDRTRKELIQSVILPKWALNNSYKFTELHRKKLESSEVSADISSWIDIIFGIQQKGVKAEEIFNLYNEETYENYEEKFNKLQSQDQEYASRLLEFGVVPHQLFSNKLPKRKGIEEIFPISQLATSAFNKSNRKIYINLKDNLKYNYFYIKSIMNEERIVLLSYNKMIMVKLSEKSDEVTKRPIYYYEQVQSYLINNDISKIDFCTFKNKLPVISYNKGTCVIVGGFVNGQILTQYFNGKDIKTRYYIQKEMSAICVMVIDNDEKFLFCGTKFGYVHIYFIAQRDSPIDLQLHKTIHDHRDAITAIHINTRLNVFATVSIDGYIMLYTMPHCKLFNLFKVPFDGLVEHIFVSSAPLPCIVYYNKQDMTWNCYAVNGKFLTQIKATEATAKAKMFTDAFFLDYILYSTEAQSVVLMEIPTLAQVKYEKNYFKNCIDFDISNDKRSCVALDVEEETIKIVVIKHKPD